jgi:alkylated DNA repair protein alkB homolog 1
MLYQASQVRSSCGSDQPDAQPPPPLGLVLLPAFVSHRQQRSLVQISLRDQARYPNETNLDTHYVLPEEGVWNAHIHFRKDGQGTIVLPRTRDPCTLPPDLGPRKLIDNTPATRTNFVALTSEPKPSSSPSPMAQPTSASALLGKLRWANIGWSYHWGSKQYDLTRGKGEVHEGFREVCKSAVRSVDWADVFGGQGQDGWDEADDLRTWNETYGIHISL